ncbi:hypothetical protein IFR05_017558, partial [Cadophora sp. M221]
IHIGPIYQMRNYGQESGRGGRDGLRSQAIIMMPVGKQEALQKSHEQAQRQPPKFHITITAKEKERIERQKVERFMSGARCRRIYLDQEMDGRIDRVRCEDEEERCDVCCESDATMEELEAKRQAYVEEARKEQEKQGRSMDSAIDIPSSSVRVGGVPINGLDSSNCPFPSSPPAYSQSSIVSFDRGFAADPISPAEREEFQSQQIQRQQQRLQVQARHQQEGHD